MPCEHSWPDHSLLPCGCLLLPVRLPALLLRYHPALRESQVNTHLFLTLALRVPRLICIDAQTQVHLLTSLQFSPVRLQSFEQHQLYPKTDSTLSITQIILLLSIIAAVGVLIPSFLTIILALNILILNNYYRNPIMREVQRNFPNLVGGRG